MGLSGRISGAVRRREWEGVSFDWLKERREEEGVWERGEG